MSTEDLLKMNESCKKVYRFGEAITKACESANITIEQGTKFIDTFSKYYEELEEQK